MRALRTRKTRALHAPHDAFIEQGCIILLSALNPCGNGLFGFLGQQSETPQTTFRLQSIKKFFTDRANSRDIAGGKAGPLGRVKADLTTEVKSCK